MKFLQRRDADRLRRLLRTFPAVLVVGPRQCGKSTLVRPLIAFWRTQAGAEVDLLIGDGRRLLPIEVKLSASVDRYAVVGLRQCMKDLGLKRGWVICNAAERRAMGGGIEIIPWAHAASGRVDLGLGSR